MSGGNWNRAGRKSGGYRKTPIFYGANSMDSSLPMLSIQCYERRHSECDKKLFLQHGQCECKCHAKPTPASGLES